MITVSFGQTLDISAGQTSSGIIVERGGTLDVLSGGIASGTGLIGDFFRNATLDVESGGVTRDTVIIDQGDEFVSSGGVADGTVVNASGFILASTLEVLSGGVASGTVLSGAHDQSAALEVWSGGVASDTEVSDGGYLLVLDGGIANGAVVGSGGIINAGGVVSRTVVGSGGTEEVTLGGIASGTLITSGGSQTIGIGGVASGATVMAGGKQHVFAGGTARRTIVSGGSENISASGRASGGMIGSGGVERVYGSATWGLVASGGRQIVESGGVAHGAAVKHGAHQIVYSGGVTRGTVLEGGSEIVYGTASGGRVNLRGLETVRGTASGGTIRRGIIEVASGGTASGTVTFISGGTLRLDAGASFTGDISGFAIPDRIDLRGVAFGSGTTSSFVEALDNTSGMLTVSDGTHSVQLTLLGSYTTANFTLATDNHGGTLVTDPPAATGLSLTYKGFNYVDYYNQEYSDHNTLPAVAGTGANAVALTPDWGIDVAQSSIYAGGETTDTTNLGTAIREANQNGMTAFVRPLVDFLYNQKSVHGPINFNPGDYYVPPGPVDTRNLPSGEPDANGGTIPATLNGTVPAGAGTDNYRGFLNPADIDVPVFFGSPTTPGSYDYMIVSEAKKAAAAGATLFSVGTELDSLADNPAYTTYWTNLIADVRAAAPSLKLTFSANWATASQVTFWNKLDYVGIDGYVPLSNTIPATAAQNPSLASLITGWNKPSNVTIAFSGGTTVSQTLGGLSAIDAFDKLAQKSINKQFIFTEFGYQNDTGAATDPTGGSNQRVTDPSLQAELYTAFFDAWGAAQQSANTHGGLFDGIRFALVGAYVWDWTPDRSNDDWSPGNPNNSAALTPIEAGFATPSPPIVISSGQTKSGVTLARGATMTVLSGGTARSTIILGGGKETVNAGGRDFNASISGKQIVSGTATAATVKTGGNQHVEAGAVASATIVHSGGGEFVAGKAGGATIDGGGVEIASGGTASGTIAFTNGGTLRLDAGGFFTGAIKDFGKPDLSDRIDLRGIDFAAGPTRSFKAAASGTSGVLTVTDGTHTVKLTLLGSYSTSSFKLAGDNHGGTLVTDPPAAADSPPLTFGDIAVARLHAGAPAPGTPSDYSPGARANGDPAYAGGPTLLTAGASCVPGGTGHNPLLAALR
ncbi:MAG TPA: hypothetical protein VGS13_15110 [Stellaceae bacterium]|nr:hypothetical protein [Stellaceae bacterium]